MLKVPKSISQIRAIYVLTTVFMVGLSFYSFIQITNLLKSSKLMYHTNQVKQTLGDISSALMDAETNKRGFLLTADSLMLFKRDGALFALTTAQKLLDSLIKGNPQQMTHAAALNLAIQEKIASIRTTRIEGIPMDIPANLRVNIDEGVRVMNIVILLLEEMTRVETALLAQRTQVFTRLSLIAPFYIIVLFLGALVILFYSYAKLNIELVKSHDLHSALVEHGEEREVLGRKLVDANQELAHQNEDKEKRSSELAIANVELGIQNEKKEKLAAELIIANHELAFQNGEKEKRAAELDTANKELQLFLNISSHDLQEPLRKIQMAASRIDREDYMALSSHGRDYFLKMQEAALSMQTLIEDLLTYSRTTTEERNFEHIDLNIIIEEVRHQLKDLVEEKQAIIEVTEICEAHIMPFQFRQLMHNIISNALKFSVPGKPPHILISGILQKGSDCNHAKLKMDMEYCHIRIEDNGIGFEPIYSEKIFEVFQRLYGKETYKGTGIGLAIVKKIVENHGGIITAKGELNKGASFDIYIPTIRIP